MDSLKHVTFQQRLLIHPQRSVFTSMALICSHIDNTLYDTFWIFVFSSIAKLMMVYNPEQCLLLTLSESPLNLYFLLLENFYGWCRFSKCLNLTSKSCCCLVSYSLHKKYHIWEKITFFISISLTCYKF